MSSQHLSCPKCGGRMEAGILIDEGHGIKKQATWTEGMPAKSFWVGGLKVPEEDRVPITVYRCERCGFLESYAHPA